jgi:HlyD family secretion protein
VVVVAIAGGLVVHARHKKAGQAVAVTTEKAAVRTVTQLVTATGKIQPKLVVKISSEVYGEIVQLPFRDGARVRKGDLLVRIKPDVYQSAVDQVTAAVAAARGAAVDSAAKVEKAKADLAQYEDLHHRKLVSDADYITYKTNYDVACADHISALANVQAAEGQLGQAQSTLSKTVIYSPLDGIVSARISEIGERVVAQSSFTGTEIMDVADPSNMEVQVNVNENDVPKVKVGDGASIAIDAYPDRKFAGVVREIASSAENTGATGSGSSAQATNTSTDEVTNFLVKISIVDKDAPLRPGMSATADIDTQTDADVVTVPIQSVTVRDAAGLTSEEVEKRKAAENLAKTGNDLKLAAGRADAVKARQQFRRVVFVKEGDKVKLRTVETGIADDTYIEVKSGVKPGEEIVSGSYAAISRTLKDGSLVKIEPVKPKSAA